MKVEAGRTLKKNCREIRRYLAAVFPFWLMGVPLGTLARPDYSYLAGVPFVFFN